MITLQLDMVSRKRHVSTAVVYKNMSNLLWYVRCDVFASRKKPNKTLRAPMSEPLWRGLIAIDVMGLLSITDCYNKYIIVILDYFMKETKSFATPNQEAETVADILVHDFFKNLEY